MKKSSPGSAILSFSSFILFCMYILFLIPVLLLCAGAYQGAVRGQELNGNLYTASSYIAARVRSSDAVTIADTPGEPKPALCFLQEKGGADYVTWLYLSGGELRELTVPEGTVPPLDMGLRIADLSSMDIMRPEGEGPVIIRLVDPEGKHTTVTAAHRPSSKGGSA